VDLRRWLSPPWKARHAYNAIMKLALLGYTPQALAFLRGAARLGHEIVAAYDAGKERTALRDAIPTIRLRDDWENLLGSRDVDAVIVAGPVLAEDIPSDVRERRDDQLRKLIQAGVPLLVIPPVCEAIVGFELEMIRKDVQGIVIPAVAAPLHAVWNELEQVSREGTGPDFGTLWGIGDIEAATLERYLPVRQRSDVLAVFAHDAHLLRRLVGPMRRIAASGGSRGEETKPSLANLAVSAQGEATFPARWSVAPVGDFVGAKLIVQGTNDRLTLLMPAGEAAWELSSPSGRQTYPPLNAVAAVLSELDAAISSQATPAVSWLETCRAVEAMEAIDRSLLRNRAVDLYNEDHSEESSFKGIMAASGCLLLLGTIAALLCAGVLTVVFRPEKGTGATYWGWMQVCLIAPLAIFLLAQLLSFGLSRHLRAKRTNSDEEIPAKIAD